jgi:superfamily II DNA helicase RecQ
MRESVPAYRVLSNATLEALARRCPRSMPALLAVKGIGEAKLTRYGDDLLALMNPENADGDENTSRKPPDVVP